MGRTLKKSIRVCICLSQRGSGSSASCVTECSANELEQLMTLRGRDVVDKIQCVYGGVEQLCQRLGTDPVNGQSAYWPFISLYSITRLHPLSIYF